MGFEENYGHDVLYKSSTFFAMASNKIHSYVNTSDFNQTGVEGTAIVTFIWLPVNLHVTIEMHDLTLIYSRLSIINLIQPFCKAKRTSKCDNNGQ